MSNYSVFISMCGYCQRVTAYYSGCIITGERTRSFCIYRCMESKDYLQQSIYCSVYRLLFLGLLLLITFQYRLSYWLRLLCRGYILSGIIPSFCLCLYYTAETCCIEGCFESKYQCMRYCSFCLSWEYCITISITVKYAWYSGELFRE